jgi:type IV secretion system protein VirB1
MRYLLFVVLLLAALDGAAQVTRLTAPELRAVTQRCAPTAPFETVFAIAKTESSLYPYALSINYPTRAAAQAGFHQHDLTLARQPRNQAEAVRWIRWLVAHHYTVSVGLMQINTETAAPLGFTAEELLQPCANIAVGTWILQHYFMDALTHYKTQPKALLAAFSAYNSGSYTHGFTNGYVSRVLSNAAHARQIDVESNIDR